ncbi:MAG: hypothetical protein ACLP8A_04600 [Methylovirgula sp.]
MLTLMRTSFLSGIGICAIAGEAIRARGKKSAEKRVKGEDMAGSEEMSFASLATLPGTVKEAQPALCGIG